MWIVFYSSTGIAERTLPGISKKQVTRVVEKWYTMRTNAKMMRD